MDMIKTGHDVDGEGLSDNDSVFSNLPVGTGTGRDLGVQIVYLWNKRRGQMVSDFCVAGWMLSPLEEVLCDAKEGRTAESLTLLWIDCWENCIIVSQMMSWMW
jgi:hypothetical protein